MNNSMDLVDFERRGEYVLVDVKSATCFLSVWFVIQACSDQRWTTISVAVISKSTRRPVLSSVVLVRSEGFGCLNNSLFWF
jgi:hypothetical protein